MTEAQKARLDKAMTESDRLAERSGRESAAIRAQLVARGDREGLAEFDQAHSMMISVRLDEGLRAADAWPSSTATSVSGSSNFSFRPTGQQPSCARKFKIA